MISLVGEQQTEGKEEGLLQEASKFMRHARRGYLTTDDVNHALRLRNVEVRPAAYCWCLGCDLSVAFCSGLRN